MSDFSSMTLVELRKECQTRGLSVSGTKAVVVARLEEYEASIAPKPAKAAKATASRTAKATAAKPAKATAAKSKKRAASEMLEADDDEEESTPAPAAATARAPPTKKGRGSAGKVDGYYRGSAKSVYEDAQDIWDVMLMQVSLERNNNKFYVIQLLESAGGYYEVFTRWGRVSEPGQNKITYSGSSLAAAKAEFGKKFKDKTKNTWGPGIRDNFKDFGSAAKAYTLMDMADADELEEPMAVDVAVESSVVKKARVRPSKLAPQIQKLLGLLFNEDTITEQLKVMNIDVNKMPIGRISKAQLEKGREELEKIAKIMAGEQSGSISTITAKYYALVPHSFGRTRPPPLNTRESLQQEFDLINTLTDMTVVQDMMAKEKEDAAKGGSDEIDHPLDRQYQGLGCEIDVLAPGNEEYEYVKKYFEATQSGKLSLVNVYRVNRAGEDKRYAAHDDLDNRKLLWHGTNIAVVVAILKTGLRIMPHSGGRVGRGIYHASENSKSAGYTRTAQKTGVMFIDEVALGKSYEIKRDDHTLTAAPKGYDSVLAQGHTEPNPAQDIEVELDGRKVIVPQGKVQHRAPFKDSYFSQSEYLVYKESQVRMRYMLEIRFPW